MNRKVIAFIAAVVLLIAAFMVDAYKAPLEAANQKNITLTFLTWQTPLRDQYEAAFQKYSKLHANVKIQFSAIPTDQYPQALQIRVASGDAPDLIQLWPGLQAVVPYAKSGLLADLSHEPWVKDLYDGPKQAVSYNGKVYAYPLETSVIGVIYNKKIFADLKLEVPRTWEDFLKVCQKIKEAGKVPIAMPAKTAWCPQFLPIYTLNGNLVYSKYPHFDDALMAGKATFARSEYKRALEMFMELNDKGYYGADPLGITIEQAEQMMVKGDAAMTVNGSWTVAELQLIDPQYPAGMFPVPAPVGYQTTIPVGQGSCYGIYYKSKNLAETKKLLKFLTEESVYNSFSKYSVALSPSKKIKTDTPAAITDKMAPAMEKASYQFTNQTWAPGIQDAWQKNFQALLSKTVSIDAVIKEMDEVAVKCVQRFKESK